MVANWFPAEAVRDVTVFRFVDNGGLPTDLYVEVGRRVTMEAARDAIEHMTGMLIKYRGHMNNCIVCDLQLVA